MLEQEIRSDIDERQRLMLQIKTLYLRYSFNEKDEQLFLNYSIPTVYAVWEGFVQTAFRMYIQQLNRLNLTADNICKPILIHHLENKFKQFREYPKHPIKKASFFDGLDQFYTQRIIDINAVVNTESNVGFDVINRLLKNFNLAELSEYPEKKYSLSKELKTLLKIRNAVAHGQDSIIVNREDLESSIKLVEILMDLVLESIIKGFENKSYLHIP
ncbi:MAG: hypothetical protein RIQ94_2629 [Pseudomonadota bacterium]|jgi:hypothetical protein